MNNDICEDMVLEGECPGVFDADTLCGEGACVVQPEGCCQDPAQDPTSCNTGVLQSTCVDGGGAWTEGDQTCNSLHQCTFEPGTGCCQTPAQDPTSCSTGVLESTCVGGGGAWTEGGQTCNSLDQCAGEPPPIVTYNR